MLAMGVSAVTIPRGFWHTGPGVISALAGVASVIVAVVALQISDSDGPGPVTTPGPVISTTTEVGVSLEAWARKADEICRDVSPRIQEEYDNLMAIGTDADRIEEMGPASSRMADLVKEMYSRLTKLRLPTEPVAQRRAAEARQDLLQAWQNLNRFTEQGAAAAVAGDGETTDRLWKEYTDPFNQSMADLSGMGAGHCTG
jgi:hypothetical protein